MSYSTESIMRYVQKKGISYFLNDPSYEDRTGFKGFLFDENGNPILSNLYLFSGIPQKDNSKDTAIM